MPLQLTSSWLVVSARTCGPFGSPCEQPFDPGGSPNLGKPSEEGYLSDRDGPNVQRQLRAISEGNVGYCGVRFNWPRKLGTIYTGLA